MFNKKGLSDIVATVLIVALALGAVAIVWQAIAPMIRDSGSRVDTVSQCLDVVAEPVSCSFSGSAEDYGAIVVVKQKEGKPVKMKAVLFLADGSTVIDEQTAGEVLSTSQFDFNNLVSAPTKVKAAAVILSGGEEFICSESSVEVKCKAGEAAACEDECTANECASGTEYQTCANTDSDECLELSVPISCGITDCDGLDIACRNYTDVSKICTGAGICGNGTCNSYIDTPARTYCASNKVCNGSGDCVTCGGDGQMCCSTTPLCGSAGDSACNTAVPRTCEYAP